MNGKGFTLLELIVVIGILAALSALALPQISRFNSSQSLQTAAANLQSDLRNIQANALNGVVCSSNYPDLASADWELVFNSSTSYDTEAACITPTPASPLPNVVSITKNLPAGVEVFDMWIDTSQCVANVPTNKGVGFSGISGNVNFIADVGDCTILSTSQKMWIGLRLIDDNSQKIYIVIDKGGSIYVSSSQPSS